VIVLVRQSQGKKHLQIRAAGRTAAPSPSRTWGTPRLCSPGRTPRGGKLALVPGAWCGRCPRSDAGLPALGWTAWSWRVNGLSPA